MAAQAQRLLRPLREIEMPVVRVLASMETLGIAIDEPALDREMCAVHHLPYCFSAACTHGPPLCGLQQPVDMVAVPLSAIQVCRR